MVDYGWIDSDNRDEDIYENLPFSHAPTIRPNSRPTDMLIGLQPDDGIYYNRPMYHDRFTPPENRSWLISGPESGLQSPLQLLQPFPGRFREC